jgi:Ca2+-binding EF-hand superfamily protein
VDLAEHKRLKGFGPYTRAQVTELAHVFYDIDRNCSGHVDRQEFVDSGMWEKYNMGSSAGSLFDSLDDDESNSISLDELVSVVLPMATYADRYV